MDTRRKIKTDAPDGPAMLDPALLDSILAGEPVAVTAKKDTAIGLIAKVLAYGQETYVRRLAVMLFDGFNEEVAFEAARRGYRNGNGNIVLKGLVR